MSDRRTIRVDKEEGVDWLSLDRPESLNAINNQLMCARTEDVQEGMRAFIEKREPIYTGR